MSERMTFWEKVIIGVVVAIMASSFSFYLDVSAMMEVYKVDKLYNDSTRKELVLTLKQLNATISKIAINIALSQHRLNNIEMDIAELKTEH